MSCLRPRAPNRTDLVRAGAVFVAVVQSRMSSTDKQPLFSTSTSLFRQAADLLVAGALTDAIAPSVMKNRVKAYRPWECH